MLNSKPRCEVVIAIRTDERVLLEGAEFVFAFGTVKGEFRSWNQLVIRQIQSHTTFLAMDLHYNLLR